MYIYFVFCIFFYQTIRMETVIEVERIRILKEETEIENHGISTLPDDCLLEIFQYLPIADKFRIERVCKRWQVLSKESWRSFKRLDCSFETWGLMRFPPKPAHIISENTFERVAHLCGNYLTSVNLSLQAFRKICKLTKNIRDLRLFDILPHIVASSENITEYEKSHWKTCNNYECECDSKDWTEIVKWLLNNSKTITKFELSLCHNYVDQEEDVGKLFLAMKNLKSFYLTDCNKIDFRGKCLEKLPFDSIEEICLINVQNLDNSLLSEVIRKCTKLKKICLYGLFDQGVDSLIHAFVDRAKTLTNINLRIAGLIEKRHENISEVLYSFSKLEQLRKLDFANASSHINDQSLRVIAENCRQITYLNISGENYVTDKGIWHISKLKKLIYLEMRDIQTVTSPSLRYMKNLQVLNCSDCRNIMEMSLVLLLKDAHGLRAMNVRNCHSVTSNLVQIADEVTKKRKSNKPLDLYIERAKMDSEFCYKKNRLLNIAVGVFAGVKYGFENILMSDRIPQIRIHTYPVGKQYLLKRKT